jgi:hypothetical protein
MKTKQGLLILLAGLSLALCHGCAKETYKIIDRGILQMQYDSLVRKGENEVSSSPDGTFVYTTSDVYAHKVVIDSTNYTYSEAYPKMPPLSFIKSDKLKPIQPLENVAVIQVNDAKGRIIIARDNPPDILKAIRDDRFYNSFSTLNVIHFVALIVYIVVFGFLIVWMGNILDSAMVLLLVILIIMPILFPFGYLLLDSIIVVLRA